MKYVTIDNHISISPFEKNQLQRDIFLIIAEYDMKRNEYRLKKGIFLPNTAENVITL